ARFVAIPAVRESFLELRGRQRCVGQRRGVGSAATRTRSGRKQALGVIHSFANTGVSRRELLADFEAIFKAHPKAMYAEQVKKSIDVLKRMIAEDEEHAGKAAKPVKAMTKKDRIAELIFQLRDQRGEQNSQPGRCNIFGDYGSEDADKRNTPAHQLV